LYQTLNVSIDDLRTEFIQVRNLSTKLFKPLRIEDAVIQSDPFGSPPNWHISHVTWFFQKILEKYGEKLTLNKSLNLEYLNSYYQKYKSILPKEERGRYPRPTVHEALKYRIFIDKQVISFLRDLERSGITSEDLIYDLQLANHHEMQHQELMVYDLQHYFNRFKDPMDNYQPIESKEAPASPPLRSSAMVKVSGGMFRLGYMGNGFCYDNELPEHKIYLEPFEIDVSPVSNGDFMKFIESGGYEEHRFWLADGWDLVKEKKWFAPLYWRREKNRWMKKDLRGWNEIDPDEPVINVSYYEADAYARWAKKRLPTEAEWEKAACWNETLQMKTIYPWGNQPPNEDVANLLECFIWGPSKIGSYPKGKSYYGCHQMIGDVWEWTSSEYTLYPKFKPKFIEYTDKWAINQKVLRGGSFSTPMRQIRCTYRNYFKPHERLLFSGFRCARYT
jgi:ergothioneine biosynthesis protein EgtB